MSNFWSVAVDAPLHESLTYLPPSVDADKIRRGVLVNVPLGRRQVRGLVLSSVSAEPEFKIKEIQSIDTEYPPLPDFFLKWLEWLSSYYMHPLGSIVSTSYPPLKKTVKARKSSRPPVVQISTTEQKQRELTDEQKQVLAGIELGKGFSPHLLFGVTGSGKTEVYLQLLEKNLQAGKQGLVLVPEIALTPQLVSRFSERFGDQVAVIHSQLTDRERTNQWWEIVDGRKKILIGARSALFCPIENLGLIVVDEEHEASYKQDEKLKYHARDAAVMLAKLSDCPIVLGSATPSLESWKNALDKKYTLHTMKERVENRAMPLVEIIDLRAQEKSMKRPFWLSETLENALEESLKKGEQSALFLNRRGVAQMVLCPSCGYIHECPNCDISLTLHGKHHLVCHYCDYHQSFKIECPSCKEGELNPVGLGTELVENDIKKRFPEARVARADRDEIQNRFDLEELIQNMEAGEIDILIGTQMIAKGLDFPKLNLVGLCLADIGFNLPDFRSTERSYQLVSQVSGRAGRHVKDGEVPGRVIVQTYNTEHPSLRYAVHHDYVGFATEELQHRAVLSYPPNGKIIAFRIQGLDLGKVQQAARLLASRARQLKEQKPDYSVVEVLGPAEAPMAKLRGQHRQHLLTKSTEPAKLHQFCRLLRGDLKWLPPGVRLSSDVDPLHLL